MESQSQDPYIAQDPSVTSQSERMDDDFAQPEQHTSQALLSRIEHNPAATRVFWFFVGLTCGAVISAIVIIPIYQS